MQIIIKIAFKKIRQSIIIIGQNDNINPKKQGVDGNVPIPKN